ncbi:MAG: beta-eliminating lyase-related protein, partial [Aestuariivirgaceae bacterium]
VQSGISAARTCEGLDSCWIDFSKGLGAPVGAVMAGSADFIERAWAVKQQLGGAMRQSGILATMCLYALDHHVYRLADDHVLAKSIATRVGELAKVERLLPVKSNIVIFDLAEDAPDAPELVRLCESDGLAIGAFGKQRIRIVTHLDVDAQAGDHLCQSLQRHLG